MQHCNSYLSETVKPNMDNEPVSVTQKIDSIFECGICFKPYNHNDKKPISLPCGHSFCFDCVK